MFDSRLVVNGNLVCSKEIRCVNHTVPYWSYDKDGERVWVGLFGNHFPTYEEALNAYTLEGIKECDRMVREEMNRAMLEHGRNLAVQLRDERKMFRD